MPLKLNLIAAASENMGIGKNNTLPWRLKTEMEYFTRMTIKTKDPSKKNVVIMGRRTWDSIPDKFKPLADRVNFVLSRSELDFKNYTDVFGFNSLQSALDKLKTEDFKSTYESIWVIGGSHIYKEAMESKHFYRLYLTEIKKDFDCDTFMPPLKENLRETTSPDIPTGVQTEKGIDFVYKIYENPDFNE